MKRIIGTYTKQKDLRHQIVDIEDVEFDATTYVLNMELSEIKKLETCYESLDEVGRAHISHDGPFEVDIKESICDFFDVEALSDITPEMLEAAREEWEQTPTTEYTVILQRKILAYQSITVTARTEAEAEEAAKQEAISDSMLQDWGNAIQEKIDDIDEDDIEVVEIE